MRYEHRRYINAARKPGVPDLHAQFEVVHPNFEIATRVASAKMHELGVRHVLIGGMAVGAYGTPRATKDIDFLVGDEAWPSHGIVVSPIPGLPFAVGKVSVDTLLTPEELPSIVESLARGIDSEGIPVAPVEVVILMKLLANRLQDQADIESMLSHADHDVARAYVKKHGPDYLAAFDAAVAYKMRQENTARRLAKGDT